MVLQGAGHDASIESYLKQSDIAVVVTLDLQASLKGDNRSDCPESSCFYRLLWRVALAIGADQFSGAVSQEATTSDRPQRCYP